ncbi:unnamed protein product [Orchesella dallaii]|uniref:Glycine-rich protein n=1 Tax=Orchesella dallaii TaxID=48710 RepID=A0ABP1RUI8_9HEXA
MAKLIFILFAVFALAAAAPKPMGGMGIGHGLVSSHHVTHVGGYGMMGYPMIGMMGYPGIIGYGMYPKIGYGMMG